jgi:serine/threonine-protein kinase RsbW
MRDHDTLRFRPLPVRAGRPAARTSVRLLAEIPNVIDRIASVMNDLGYSRRDIFAVQVTLQEAIVNAIKHGDSRRPVQIAFRIGADDVLATVADQGKGFDPAAVADPLAEENLERPCGRGLLMMRSLMSWVRFNTKGNCVTVCRRRSGIAQAA